MTAHTYGIELETIGLNPSASARAITRAGVACQSQNYNHETSDNWKALRDGSLPDQSSEVVSPVLGNERLNEVSVVARALLQAGARVTKSAGFHVHMGASQLGDSLGRLVVNWYSAHNTIVSMVAPSRIGSRWCNSLSISQAEMLASDISGMSGSDFNRYDRYKSLNLNSIARHGTIEFRLHQGTLNGTKALAWVEFLTAFVNYSMDFNSINADFNNPRDPEARLNELPRLLATIRDYGLSASAHDYLIRHAQEICARQ